MLEQPAAGAVMPPKSVSTESASTTHLEGRMGVASVSMSVLAFSAPIVSVAGTMPFLIFFGGTGGPITYLLCTVLLMLFAAGFTTMASHLPRPGAFYAFISAGLGKVAGLGAAFLAMVGYTLIGMCLPCFLGLQGNALVHDTLGGPEIAWYWYGLAGCVGSGLLAYRNIELSAKVLGIAMILEIVMVTVFSLAVVGDGGPQGLSAQPFGWSALTGGNSVGIAILFAAGTYFGFEATAIYREEVKDPEKTVPRATYVCVLGIGLFYAFACWALIMAFGTDNAERVANDDAAGMFQTAMGQFVGGWARDVVSVLLVTSGFAALLSIQNVVTRYIFSLGVDGALPRTLGAVHPKHQSPHRASLVSSAVFFLFVLTFGIIGSDPTLLYSRTSGTGSFCVLLLLFLTSIAVFTYFRRNALTVGANAFKTVVAPVLSAIGLGAIVVIALIQYTDLVGATGSLATILLIITFGVLIGGMTLALVLKQRQPEVYERIGRRQL